MPTFAEILKSKRKSSGMSQPELAVAASISQSTISRYEAGKTEPKWLDVQRIAAALGLPCSEFHEINAAVYWDGTAWHHKKWLSEPLEGEGQEEGEVKVAH